MQKAPTKAGAFHIFLRDQNIMSLPWILFYPVFRA